jgi:hypothetical protein
MKRNEHRKAYSQVKLCSWDVTWLNPNS